MAFEHGLKTDRQAVKNRLKEDGPEMEAANGARSRKHHPATNLPDGNKEEDRNAVTDSHLHDQQG